MKFIDLKQLRVVLERFDKNDVPLCVNTCRSTRSPDLSYKLPVEATRLAAIGCALSSVLTLEGSVVAWIANVEAWSSGEDEELLRFLFRGTSALGSVSDTALILEPSDEKVFIGLLKMILLMSWDAWLIEGKGDGIYIEVSHDGILSFWVKSVASKKTISDYLNKLAVAVPER